MFRVNVLEIINGEENEWVQSFNSRDEAEEFQKTKDALPHVKETKFLDGSKSHK